MRAKNMQSLTDDIKRSYPGVTVYGIGDDAHKLEVSDHNEDDTPGVRAAQSDDDNIPEHRAIDVMLGPSFTKEQADRLVARMVNDPATRARLIYVIWNGHIWSASNGWEARTYTGSNPHIDHVHLSGKASDDDNTASWPIVAPAQEAPAPAEQPMLKRDSSGAGVTKLQAFLRNTFPAYRFTVVYKRGQLISVDGKFGPQTEAWVKEFQRRTGLRQDGIVGPATFAMLRRYGFQH